MKIPMYIVLITGAAYGLEATQTAQCAASASLCRSQVESTMLEIMIATPAHTPERIQQECNAAQAYRECMNRRTNCPSTEADSKIPLKGFNVTCINHGLNSLTRPTLDPCYDNENNCAQQLLTTMIRYLQHTSLKYSKNIQCRTINAYRQCLGEHRECQYTEAEIQKHLKDYNVRCAATGLSSLTSVIMIFLLTTLTTWIIK